MGLSAVVGAATAIIGGKSAKKAANQQAAAVAQAGESSAAATERAAELQYKASQEAMQMSREQYEQNMRLLMPYLSGGAESYGRAQALLAAGPPTVTYQGFASYAPQGSRYTPPQQMSAIEFTPTPPSEEIGGKIADLEGQIAKHQTQIGGPQYDPRVYSPLYGLANSILSGGAKTISPPQIRIDGYDAFNRPYQMVNGGMRLIDPLQANQYNLQTQQGSQYPQAQGDLTKATAELQSLKDQEAQRVAKEKEAYDQAMSVISGYNRGIASGTGPQSVEYTQSPGYQFRMDEGLKAIERGAAARGRIDSGETMKALQTYGQGVAAQDFERFEQQRKQDYYNYLSALTGQSGQAASNQAAALGQSAATQAANLMTGGAAAYGQGIASAGQQRASSYANQAAISSNASNQYTQNLLSGIQGLYGYGEEKKWW